MWDILPLEVHNMQNNNHNQSKKKGYYILLGLCLIAVGVSAWYFLGNAAKEAQQVQPVLSIPVEEVKPEQEQPKDKPTASTEEEQQQPEQSEPQEQSKPEARETVLPVSGDVVNDYAMDKLTYNSTTKDWRVHDGVDLAAEPGTPVKAAKAGTVSDIYEDDYYGVTVSIAHADGYVSCYSNLDTAVLTEIGKTVAAGDTIGSVGTTALMESGQESHLHFAVTCNGASVDPAGFLY